MSENKLSLYSESTKLLVADASEDIREAARKLMRLTPNGGRLSADQATDLAVYAFITGLNPYNAECYYMDKVGPVPGIAGYRVKAIAWLRATSPSKFMPRLWEEYREATETEASFDKASGDVAWVCTLYDSVSKEQWEQRVISLGLTYIKMGATFKEAHDTALIDAGPCPGWSAVGVVKADEHFSGNVYRNNQKIDGEYKPEMWDRNERAKKRAAKGCYRKGFPSVYIPDREEGDVIDSEFSEIKQEISSSLKELADDNGNIVHEYANEEERKQAVDNAVDDLFGAAPVHIDEPQPVRSEPEPADEPHVMTIEEAEAMWSESMKAPYGTVETAQLTYALNSMLKKQTLENENKRTAIQIIIKARQNGRPVQKAQTTLI